MDGVAALARLELSDDEAELFGEQLATILEYAEQVQQIDTSGVPPTASVVTSVAERPDIVRPSLDRDAALSNAPDPHPASGLFKVPRVIG